MRKPTFRGRGTHSQGTKWFGTWELQVKLRVLPADGQARAPAQGRASRSTQTPGQEDPNPGLPSTLHLRAVQGRMGKVTLILKPSTSAQSPQSPCPTRRLRGQEHPQACDTSPHCLRGGKALLGFRFETAKQS